MLPIMVASSRMDKRTPVLSALLALFAVPAAAATLQVDVERIATTMATLEHVSVELAWPEASATGELRVAAQVLQFADTGYVFAAPRWRCTLQRDDAGDWRCAGKATAKTGQGTLALATDGATRVDASFARGKARLSLAYPFDGTALPIEVRALPADWLQPLLAKAWPQARFTGGTLDADLQIDPSDADALAIAGTLSTTALGLDTTDGLIAAAGLGASGPVALHIGDTTRVELELALAGGELLAGPVYAALPATNASLALTAEGSGDRWTLPRIDWRDPEALRAQGSATLDLAADSTLRDLQLQVASPDLALAHERYLASLLGTLGLDGLTLAGAAEATVTQADGKLQAAVLDLRAVDAVDDSARFAVGGAQGRVGWQRSGSLEGELRWRDAALYDIPLGATVLHWRSADGGLALRQPATVPVLGGSLALQGLAWIPGEAGAEPELSLSLALADVDLAALSRRFDWPEFGGTLSGRIPSARYEGGVLTLDGGLDIGLFDGRIEIGTLALERPFGVAPTLGADIRIERLDLVPLTEAFGFGRISGRLDGRIDGLRLVDWQPVAFDAALHTSTSAKDKRRISQRAVSDLSSVGGGGIAGGIQQQVLRMFETFPYARIGLSCRLDNNVCTMGGVPGGDSSAGGYTIVEGSGLPRITVVGHQRRVDWPVLVSRLQAATAGQGPVVE